MKVKNDWLILEISLCKGHAFKGKLFAREDVRGRQQHLLWKSFSCEKTGNKKCADCKSDTKEFQIVLCGAEGLFRGRSTSNHLQQGLLARMRD